MKMVLGSIVFIIFLIVGFLAWASSPWSLHGGTREGELIQLDEVGEDVSEEPAVIKVLTWNLGFLYGKGSEGPGYEFRQKDFYEQKINTLIKEIKNWDPDVILFQEIDLGSQRSHGVNQALYVANKVGYPFVAQAASWEANYIPFPYYPFKNHFGQMKSGGAILSKYPIASHKVELLPKPLSQPWWYNLFYLHRYFQKVSIDFGGGKQLSFVNLHLEAFDKVDRAGQIKALLAQKDPVDIVAGDFNMIPDSAIKRRKFFNDDDYENDPSFSLMAKSHLSEVIPEEIYSKDESSYFTFPAWKPDRRLDYIFYEKGHKMIKAEVLPSSVSDHLPVRASFQIGTPKFNPYQ